MSEARYKVGDRVYYIEANKVYELEIEDIKLHENGVGSFHEYLFDESSYDIQNDIYESDLFPTKAALLEHITKQIEELE